MLLQFNVKNFMSIKNEVVLSLYANKSKEHLDNLIVNGKERVLPVVAVYGANAAGKSNLFKALSAAINFVRRSNYMQPNDITGMIPFLFDIESRQRPTRMDFKFIYNGEKYEYGFEADSRNVYEEYLYIYHSAKPSMIFERTEKDKYKFSIANKKELSQYIDKNLPNKLFLCTATAWNCQLTKDAFMWFAEKIDTYGKESFTDVSWIPEMDNNKENEQMKEFILSLLKHAEINIDDFIFETKEIPNGEVLFPQGIAVDKNTTVKSYNVETVHIVDTEGHGKQRFRLPFHMESDGTKLLVAYAPEILKALMYGRTIIIDEIDSSLHPSLVRYLIELFTDLSINRNSAQLIFNSHDISQLDSEFFRRDQIYFAEKDNNTGITDLYSLADYSPRIGENIQKGYLQGRYGAIPFIRGGIEW